MAYYVISNNYSELLLCQLEYDYVIINYAIDNNFCYVTFTNEHLKNL